MIPVKIVKIVIGTLIVSVISFLVGVGSLFFFLKHHIDETKLASAQEANVQSIANAIDEDVSQYSEKESLATILVFERSTHRATSEGTGFWVNDNRTMFTAYHVVKDQLESGNGRFDLLVEWKSGAKHYLSNVTCMYAKKEQDVCVLDVKDNIEKPLTVYQDSFSLNQEAQKKKLKFNPLNEDPTKRTYLPMNYSHHFYGKFDGTDWNLDSDGIDLLAFTHVYNGEVEGSSGGPIINTNNEVVAMVVTKNEGENVINGTSFFMVYEDFEKWTKQNHK